MSVAWTAADGDGDPLTTNILYSRDGGATFASLRVAVTGRSVVIPAAELAGTTQGKIRLVVSDGVNTVQVDSKGTFRTPNQRPQVQILTPGEAAVFPYGQPAALAGSATDAEDGTLSRTSLTWLSSRDGTLGTGETLDTDSLSIGTHVITLRATDSTGLTTSVTRSVTISGDAMLPQAALLVVPTSASFSATVGSTALQTQALSLRNTEVDALNWKATGGAAWLEISAAQGVTPAEPELRVDPSGLAVGSYTATVTLSASKAAGVRLPDRTIQVYLTIAPSTAKRIDLPAIRRSGR